MRAAEGFEKIYSFWEAEKRPVFGYSFPVGLQGKLKGTPPIWAVGAGWVPLF